MEKEAEIIETINQGIQEVAQKGVVIFDFENEAAKAQFASIAKRLVPANVSVGTGEDFDTKVPTLEVFFMENNQIISVNG